MTGVRSHELSRRMALRAGAFGLLAGPFGVVGTESHASGGGVPQGYELTFSDEFDDPDVSRINENATGGRPGAPAWRSRYRHPRKDAINQEKQIYMDAAFAGTSDKPLGIQPFRIANGVLEIKAERADPKRVSPFVWDRRYTSGCITTELTHRQRYGYYEVRAKVPRGKGFWPAFWLLPMSGAWPPEIDIVEISGARPRSIWTNVHPPKGTTSKAPATPRAPMPGRWLDDVADITDGFHVYAMEWTPERITCFFDGKPVSEVEGHGIHEEMYFIANLALGSHEPNWIPDPDDTTPFPGVLSIDYVRIYRKA